MKNFYSIIYLTFSLLISFVGFAQTNDSRIVDDFSKLEVWGNIKIDLIKSDTNSILIDSKTNPTEVISTEIKKGVLKIKTKSDLFKETTIQIKINYKAISQIKANASAQINFIDPIIQEFLKIEAIGGARIVLTAEVGQTELTAYQGGQIDITGKAGFSKIFANSGGIISGTNFLIDAANIRLNTGGKAELTINKKIVARVNTKSRLSFFGKPEIEEIKSSLGSSISKWDE